MKRKKEINSVPENYIDTEEACRYLNISYATLNRYINMGMLPVMRVRYRCAKGVRKKCFYLRSGVRRLRYHLQALKRKNPNTEPDEIIWTGRSDFEWYDLFAEEALCRVCDIDTRAQRPT